MKQKNNAEIQEEVTWAMKKTHEEEKGHIRGLGPHTINWRKDLRGRLSPSFLLPSDEELGLVVEEKRIQEERQE